MIDRSVRPFKSPRWRNLLTYVQATDVNALALTANTYVSVLPAAQNFSVQSPSSLIGVVVSAHADVIPTGANVEYGVHLLIDSTRYHVAGEIAYTTTRRGIFEGAATELISGLAVGSHTLNIQAYSIGSASNYYCIPATNGVYFMQIQVWEIPQ